ncbi:cysteine-rich receptor-like protein kinase 25 isoform X2 [Ipomoea triloba]|uniref:cysteine-rich receptor-like protein kinase 25 isoform X2 n=1 Tax=Ipomoea triloba TaxID=35885 RepID=UPI00125E9033|nr:cysteine-rich receptor-like protein kinase 25 isoform X2 [Ipomoea triloba]
MDFQKCMVFLYLSCIILLSTVQPDDDLFWYSQCGASEKNYTQNSTYHTNLNTVLSNLSSNLNDYGFSNVSMGDNPDRVSAVALCRGDVEADICRSCVEDAGGKTVQWCPNQKEAFGGHDECMIHYSNVSTLGSWSSFPEIYLANPYNSSIPEQFNQGLQNLLEDLRGRAANGFPLRKFAANYTKGPDFRTIFAAVQCSPDLAAPICFDCLTSAFEFYAGCEECKGKKGGRVVSPSCNFRFETKRFYNHTLIGPPPDGNNQTVIIVVCIAADLIGIVICIFVIYKKLKKRKAPNSNTEWLLCGGSVVEPSMNFELSTLQNATDNFSEANKIGEGDFGIVYKGKLQNGKLIAVKRLSKSSRQGNLEFKNEVELIAKLQHKNLVKLFGYCQEEGEMILVYEFVPNGGLDDILFDPVKRGYLNWERRYKIIENIARGLVYLHEDSRHRIIHRDLKANNILIDEDLNPKIADFGMARLFALNQTQGSTNTLVGAYGYVAPEYARYGKFSEKSDVYSFGVLVLEIISGQRNTIQYGEFTRDLLFDVWTHWKKGSVLNVIDSILKRPSSPMHEIKRCIHLALLCVQESAVDRPKMSQVLQMLSRISSVNPPEPLDPGFFTQGSANS